MNNASRYYVDKSGYRIISKATNKVVAQAHPYFKIPDNLRDNLDKKRIYIEPEELIRRLLKQAMLGGDMTGGGYHINDEGTAIVDGKGRVAIAAVPFFYGAEYRDGSGSVMRRTHHDPQEALVDVLVADAASSWVSDRWSNNGFERALKDGVLRVEFVRNGEKRGWIALRDGSILTTPDNAPVFYSSDQEAKAAALDTHSATTHTALRFSNAASLAAIKGGYPK
jgi:hypothetical protein